MSCIKGMFASKLWAIIVLVAAVVMAIFLGRVNYENAEFVRYLGGFFRVLLPVLATGALIKYLFSGCKSADCDKSEKNK